MPVADRVAESFEQQYANALGPAHPVGGGGEGLAAPVGGEGALVAVLDEGTGCRHHGDATGESHRALPRAQRLGGEVQGHQGGGTRGVDGDGRSLDTEDVGHPPGQDAAGRPGAQVGRDPFGNLTEGGGVVVVHHAGEHGDRFPPNGERVDASAFEGLPGRLQQQPLLGVHGQCLAGRDAEQFGVEVARAREEATLRGVGGTGPGPGRVQYLLQGPPPVGGEPGDGIPSFDDEVPQVVRGVDAARVAAAHRDDGDRLVVAFLAFPQAFAGLVEVDRDAPEVLAQLLLVRHQACPLRCARGISAVIAAAHPACCR